jgi:hypothetical protein
MFMKNYHHRSFASTSFVLFILLMSSFATAYAGGEYYAVYLNDKLILKQGITSAGIQLKNIPLENARPEDKITIIYRRCHNENSTGRKITVKDERGKVLKEWKFADSTDAKNSMTISVKELMALHKTGAALHVEYSSEQLAEGRTLVAFSFPTTKHANL